MLTQGIPGVSLDEAPVEEAVPHVPLDLLEALESRFPNVVPDLRISQLDYGKVHGNLEVVRLLREWHNTPSVMSKEKP
jgi:hypothetical protein